MGEGGSALPEMGLPYPRGGGGSASRQTLSRIADPMALWEGRPPLWTDKCLWKHYLPATSFADGNNMDKYEGHIPVNFISVKTASCDCWILHNGESRDPPWLVAVCEVGTPQTCVDYCNVQSRLSLSLVGSRPPYRSFGLYFDSKYGYFGVRNVSLGLTAGR